ncbi:hypothetical protein [Segatella buccae]|nr:hypothetical protein [Segatella buccae]
MPPKCSHRPAAMDVVQGRCTLRSRPVHHPCKGSARVVQDLCTNPEAARRPHFSSSQ